MNREQAEEVLKAVHEFTHSDEAKLYDADHEELPEGSFSIALEGFEFGDLGYWPSIFLMAYRDQFPDIYMEPMNSWCLALYDNE